MKILVLSKRQYMGKDLLGDRFGRFWELPWELARLGHQVKGLSLSYRRRDEHCLTDASSVTDSQVQWQSVNLLRGFKPGFKKYFECARRLVDNYQPDLIWAVSDAYHAILGARLSRKYGTKCIVDLYDNFETFKATKVPGVLSVFRRSVKQADGVTFFSQRMADHVVQRYPLHKPHAVILSGVRKDLFYPQDRRDCRQRLGLPLDARIIGVAGALDPSRDIDTLFSSFETLAVKDPELNLAFAGARSAKQKFPSGPRVHDFNSLPHEDVATFLNSLDVAVVCYRRSAQGKYSFPQKAYEIIACRVPLVAAAVGSMNELLCDYPECLYEPQNTASLANAIRRQLHSKTIIETTVPSWADSAKRLSDFFLRIVSGDFAPAVQTLTK
jgi:glycosyltransferase involved in cell wall biosynthesis